MADLAAHVKDAVDERHRLLRDCVHLQDVEDKMLWLVNRISRDVVPTAPNTAPGCTMYRFVELDRQLHAYLNEAEGSCVGMTYTVLRCLRAHVFSVLLQEWTRVNNGFSVAPNGESDEERARRVFWDCKHTLGLLISYIRDAEMIGTGLPWLQESGILPENNRNARLRSTREASKVWGHFTRDVLTDGGIDIDRVKEQIDNAVKESLKISRDYYNSPLYGKLKHTGNLMSNTLTVCGFPAIDGNGLKKLQKSLEVSYDYVELLRISKSLDDLEKSNIKAEEKGGSFYSNITRLLRTLLSLIRAETNVAVQQALAFHLSQVVAMFTAHVVSVCEGRSMFVYSCNARVDIILNGLCTANNPSTDGGEDEIDEESTVQGSAYNDVIGAQLPAPIIIEDSESPNDDNKELFPFEDQILNYPPIVTRESGDALGIGPFIPALKTGTISFATYHNETRTQRIRFGALNFRTYAEREGCATIYFQPIINNRKQHWIKANDRYFAVARCAALPSDLSSEHCSVLCFIYMGKTLDSDIAYEGTRNEYKVIYNKGGGAFTAVYRYNAEGPGYGSWKPTVEPITAGQLKTAMKFETEFNNNISRNDRPPTLLDRMKQNVIDLRMMAHR